MGGSDKFCLKLDDFESNISTSFHELRQNEDFCDATLACDDGQPVEVHKVILSASSTFFKRIFRANKHAHPFIYLRGVSRPDLVQMVDFIYNGEVNIEEDSLQRFLDIAEEFKLRGMSGEDKPDFTEHFQQKMTQDKILHNNIINIDTIKKDMGDVSVELVEPSDEQLSMSIAEEHENEATMMYLTNDVSKNQEGAGLNYKEWIRMDGKEFQCIMCGKIGSDRSNMRRHVRKYHLAEMS